MLAQSAQLQGPKLAELPFMKGEMRVRGRVRQILENDSGDTVLVLWGHDTITDVRCIGKVNAENIGAGHEVTVVSSRMTVGRVGVALWGCRLNFSGGRSDGTGRPSEPTYFAPPESKISIRKWNWSKGGFDTVMMATFTLRNDNPFPVKDIKIKCRLSGNSGTNIDSVEETIYNIIPATTTKTFQEVNMGFIRSQTTQASCEVESAARSH